MTASPVAASRVVSIALASNCWTWARQYGGDFRLRIGGSPERSDDDVVLTFDSARALRWCAESHPLGEWPAKVGEGVYEIAESGWVTELRAATAEHLRHSFEMRHFWIDVPDCGTYEVVAASVALGSPWESE